MPSGQCQCDLFVGNVTIEATNSGIDPLRLTIANKNTQSNGRRAQLLLTTSYPHATTGDGQPSIKMAVQSGSGEVANQRLRFLNANDQDLLVLRHDGKVGINTQAPELPLQISDSSTPGNDARMRFIARSSDGSTTHRWDIGAAYGAYGNGNFVIHDASNMAAPAVAVKSPSGNVGIGTTDPGHRLQVQNATGADLLSLRATTGQQPRLNVSVPNIGETSPTFRVTAESEQGAAANKPRLAFVAGRVGIGDTPTVPDAMLGVANGTGDALLSLRANVARNPRLNVAIYDVLADQPTVTLAADSDLAAKPHLALAPGLGRVGIGTTGPEAKLSVAGVGGTPLLQLRATDGNLPRLTVDTLNAGSAAPTYRVFLGADNNAQPNLALAVGGGKVGIGTDDPGNTLQVQNTDGTNLFSVRATQGKAPRLNVGMVNTPNDQPTILMRAESQMTQPPDKPRLVLTAGRVGIGTTDTVPDATLGVSNGTGLALFSLLATGDPQPRLTIDYKNSEDVTPRGQFSLVTGNANNQQPDLVLTPLGGNVGIGTGNLAPTEKLRVGGNISASGNIAAGNDLTASNNASIVNNLTVVNGTITVGSKTVADSGGCYYA